MAQCLAAAASSSKPATANLLDTVLVKVKFSVGMSLLKTFDSWQNLACSELFPVESAGALSCSDDCPYAPEMRVQLWKSPFQSMLSPFPACEQRVCS